MNNLDFLAFVDSFKDISINVTQVQVSGKNSSQYQRIQENQDDFPVSYDPDLFELISVCDVLSFFRRYRNQYNFSDFPYCKCVHCDEDVQLKTYRNNYNKKFYSISCSSLGAHTDILFTSVQSALDYYNYEVAEILQQRLDAYLVLFGILSGFIGMVFSIPLFTIVFCFLCFIGISLFSSSIISHYLADINEYFYCELPLSFFSGLFHILLFKQPSSGTKCKSKYNRYNLRGYQPVQKTVDESYNISQLSSMLNRVSDVTFGKYAKETFDLIRDADVYFKTIDNTGSSYFLKKAEYFQDLILMQLQLESFPVLYRNDKIQSEIYESLQNLTSVLDSMLKSVVSSGTVSFSAKLKVMNSDLKEYSTYFKVKKED